MFSVYQKAAKRRGKLSGRYLVAFDAALSWADFGTKRHNGEIEDASLSAELDRITEQSAL